MPEGRHKPSGADGFREAGSGRDLVKQTIILIVVVIVVGAALYFGLSEDSGSGAPVLRVDSRLWSQPHERDFVLREVIAPFEQAHACRVDLQVFDDDKLYQRAEVQRQTGRVTTDVVIVYVSRMPRWVKAGLVEDLTPLASQWAKRSFAAAFAKMTTFDGKPRFLPIGADDYLLCANKDALKYLPKGADPQAITWAQLVAWARAAAKGEKEGKYAVTGVAQKMLTYQVSAAILSYGGGFPDVGSPEALEAWQVLAGLKGALTPTVRTYETVVPAMKRGEAWLTVTHNARVGEVYASNPTRFVVAPAPLGPAGRGSVAGVSGLGVMAGAPNRELAAKFLAYVTRPEVQLKLSKGTGGFIPTVTAAAKLLGDSTQDEVVRKSITVLEQGRLAYIPPVANWGAVKLVYDEAFKKIVLTDGKVDAAWLRAAQKRIEALR